jgi:hypothetical protein
LQCILLPFSILPLDLPLLVSYLLILTLAIMSICLVFSYCLFGIGYLVGWNWMKLRDSSIKMLPAIYEC